MKKSESSGIQINRKENPFVQIDHKVFKDNRLSFKAKGILGYLLTKPDKWIVRVEDLYKHTCEGYSSIRSGLTELVLAGYMELKTITDGDEFKGRIYSMYEVPLFDKGFRKLENRNKSFKKGEELIAENPLGDKKVRKVKANNDII